MNGGSVQVIISGFLRPSDVTTSGASRAGQVQQPQRAPDGAPIHYERHHRPEQTTLYRFVQQHAATFFAVAEAAAGADLPQFVAGRVRRLPRLRRPGPRLLAVALRRLRPQQAGRLQLQAARLLPVMRARQRVTNRCPQEKSRFCDILC